MRRGRWHRRRAALLAAAVSGSTSLALARDTAGPEPPRSAEPTPTSAAPAATSVPRGPGATPASPRAATAAGVVAPGPDAPSDADAERAKQLYALGAEAFAARRNADAIRYFRRASELVPSAKLIYNIGLAYEEMGDTGRALAAYRRYLRQDAEADATRRDELRRRIASLEQRLAETGVQQLLVTSEPPGATVRVAGRALGLTPWAGELPPGQHVVSLELPGHAPESASVTVAPDHAAELSLSLAPLQKAPATSRWASVSPVTWTFLGVGGGALAGGLAFELSRASSSDAAARAGDVASAAEARGAADAKQMASLLLLGVGAGFTISGAVLLALDLSEPDPSTQAAFAVPCTAAFCGIAAGGSF